MQKWYACPAAYNKAIRSSKLERGWQGPGYRGRERVEGKRGEGEKARSQFNGRDPTAAPRKGPDPNNKKPDPNHAAHACTCKCMQMHAYV